MRRLAVGGVLLAVLEVVRAGPARAVLQTASVGVNRSNWYWREQPSSSGVAGVGVPASIPDPSVPSGDLVVAGPTTTTGPNPGADKEGYMAFDLSAIPPGGLITSFKLTLPVDPAGLTVTGGMAPPIVACAVQTPWSAGSGAQPFADKPRDACGASSPKVVPDSRGTAFSMDIASIAQHWLEPGALNTGVALTDDPADTTHTYQVTFGPGSALGALRAEVSFIVPPPRSRGETSSASGQGTPSPAVNLGGFAAAVGGPTAPRSLTAGDTPVLPGAGPSGSRTVSAANPSRPQALLPVVASRSGGVPLGFWLLAATLAAALVAVSLVLGDRGPLTTPKAKERV